MSEIYQIVRQNEDDFNKKSVRVVDGYNFNQSQTIKRINLYANGQFLDGNSDELGEKIFFDVTTPAVRNAAKNIDLDTKDIQFRAINGKGSYFQSWLYRRRAKDWMRENKLASKLNEIPEKVCGYGSVVVKRVKGKRVFEFVDLRNMACDGSSKRLVDGWVSERHYYTPNELRKQKERGWDGNAIEKAITNFLTFRQENFVGDVNNTERKHGNAQYICVHEYYGYVQKKYLTDDEKDTDLVLANFIVILPEDAKDGRDDGKKSKECGLTLFRSEIDEMPYKELHYRKVDGRWLGRGIYEECFPMQETENTRNNQRLLAMRLSQLIIFQTRDKTILQNVLNDLVNGSVIKFGASDRDGGMLSRLDTSARDNGSSSELGNTTRQVLQGLTNSFEVTTGETLPSGTPFSLGALMNQNANKLFEFIREDYGVFLEEIFNDWVLPELEKDLLKEGMVIVDDKEELDYVREHYANFAVWDGIKKLILTGAKPTLEQIQITEKFIRDQLSKQNAIAIDVPKDFLKFEKRVTCVVTDESESLSMLQSLTNVLQVVARNPAVLEMPVFQRILDLVGLSKIDVMGQIKQEQPPQPQPQPQPTAPAGALTQA